MSQSPPSGERPTIEGEVAGEIIGALLNAITFGALDGPASARTHRPDAASGRSHPRHA